MHMNGVKLTLGLCKVFCYFLCGFRDRISGTKVGIQSNVSHGAAMFSGACVSRCMSWCLFASWCSRGLACCSA